MYMFSVDVKWHGMDAEYAYTLKVDEESDVYSFGWWCSSLSRGRGWWALRSAVKVCYIH
jgi:hypothetical protein